MNLGHKLIIVGIVLLAYWAVATWMRIEFFDSIIIDSVDAFGQGEIDYPWWWFAIRIKDYASWAGFIVLVVGIAKTYMIWRLDKNQD